MTTTRAAGPPDLAPVDDDALEDGLAAEFAERHRGPRVSVRAWVAVVVVTAVAAVSALVAVLVVRPVTPGDDSVEAGFARDMQEHHAQAVEMSVVVRDRTDDAAVRTLAYDIETTQQQQLGQMYGWLVSWGDSQARTGPHMAWMEGHGARGGHGGDMSMTPTDGPMPGMASDADLARLHTLSGRDAEVLFLQLMIVHHRAGVQMADAVLGLTDRPEVVRLATAMSTSQNAEIELMQRMLAERGATERTG